MDIFRICLLYFSNIMVSGWEQFDWYPAQVWIACSSQLDAGNSTPQSAAKWCHSCGYRVLYQECIFKPLIFCSLRWCTDTVSWAFLHMELFCLEFFKYKVLLFYFQPWKWCHCQNDLGRGAVTLIGGCCFFSFSLTMDTWFYNADPEKVTRTFPWD